MKTSSRPRGEIGGSFANRRGHVPQLSISDTNHHKFSAWSPILLEDILLILPSVTEAIGDMYGDDDYSKRDSRPLSFMPESIETKSFVTSPLHESSEPGGSYIDVNSSSSRPSPNASGKTAKKAHTSPAMLQSPRSASFEKATLSPTLSLRNGNSMETATAQFPLNDIDYESNPAAVAQELNNLQALRRMSMDVGNTSDPDLPSFQGASFMPSIAPTGDDNENDPSRLFWVPARVHPELAPMEFKTFIEKKVQVMKRRSGEQASLSPDSLERSGSGSSLRRKKSMLSRQIDNDGGRGGIGYKDGAEQLERKKSLSTQQTPELKISDLKELETLVRDPSRMQQLSLDTSNRMNGEVPEDEDMPILPQAPGIGLRRSTRTTYRRGSLRKGERVPFSKRAGALKADTDGEESPVSSPVDGRPQIGLPLTRVQSEPTSTENFSRPNRGARRLQNLPQTSPTVKDDILAQADTSSTSTPSENASQIPQPGSLPRSSTFPRNDTSVPRIVETPPPPEVVVEAPATRQLHQFPERKSSQSPAPIQHQMPPEPPARSSRRPTLDRQTSSSPQAITRPSPPKQTLNDMTQHPSPLPGSSASTDTLTFIPTLDERKPEKKSKKEKDDADSSSRKTSWGWFKGSDEKEKKEKKKDDDHKKTKPKVVAEKAHDNTRLDVLQSTMDAGAPRGRESLLLDRDSVDVKLQDERKKESSRKSGGEHKKEKDGLFSSFFSSSKKKGDRDSTGKKGSSLRTLSPEPPRPDLKPDIDYSWTRFSILEERAIYRMAHIKLANPRRALYSQVLLSNFMYGYLAKVQQAHPEMSGIPQSAVQKKQEAERRAKEQQELQRRQQQQQQPEPAGEQYRYDYHQGITQYAEQQQEPKPEGVNYVDDSQIYDHDHQDAESSHSQGSNRPQSRASQHNQENGYGDQGQGQYVQQGKDYYHQYGRSDGHEEDESDDMW
ncbi:related to SNF5-component of SWI/SNF transcription activator complex [Phialocephala subalpina]|uniref:Related to SNF5-component of SWI/SNF transcription activator complex n=1 Tax=Phialocephala subalpina TaxID=576137 RepID=A0A1L7WGT5_9HELO|nr:related to SNF5-component of SWI/SNF transcription activator complex [Phialocephala subalpina]